MWLEQPKGREVGAGEGLAVDTGTLHLCAYQQNATVCKTVLVFQWNSIEYSRYIERGKLWTDVLLLCVTWSSLLSKLIFSWCDKKPSRYRGDGNTSVVMVVFRWYYKFLDLAVSFRLAWRTALSYGKKLLCNSRQRKMNKKPSSDLNERLKLSDMISAGSLLKFSLIFF